MRQLSSLMKVASRLHVLSAPMLPYSASSSSFFFGLGYNNEDDGNARLEEEGDRGDRRNGREVHGNLTQAQSKAVRLLAQSLAIVQHHDAVTGMSA